MYLFKKLTRKNKEFSAKDLLDDIKFIALNKWPPNTLVVSNAEKNIIDSNVRLNVFITRLKQYLQMLKMDVKLSLLLEISNVFNCNTKPIHNHDVFVNHFKRICANKIGIEEYWQLGLLGIHFDSIYSSTGAGYKSDYSIDSLETSRNNIEHAPTFNFFSSQALPFISCVSGSSYAARKANQSIERHESLDAMRIIATYDKAGKLAKIICAVSDGIGGHFDVYQDVQIRLAAATACVAACHMLALINSHESLRENSNMVITYISALIEYSLPKNFNEYATLLAFTIDLQSQQIYGMNIGDGGLICFDKNLDPPLEIFAGLKPLSVPLNEKQIDEHKANGSIGFFNRQLTSNTRLIACTDGVLEPYHNNETVAEYIKQHEEMPSGPDVETCFNADAICFILATDDNPSLQKLLRQQLTSLLNRLKEDNDLSKIGDDVSAILVDFSSEAASILLPAVKNHG